MYLLNLIILYLMCLDHVNGLLFQGIRSSFVLVNEPFTFPCDVSACDRAEWRKVHPSDTSVAPYQNQTCGTRGGFHNDFTCEGNHLRLKAAKYTDRGIYKFICDQAEHSLRLDVLYAPNETVTQMDNITLDCYHADRARDVTWLRNNETVVHSKRDGYVSTGRGFKGRASVEKSCFNTGRFSLTITAVQQSDAGLYRCFVDDERTKGYPHAYLLHVNEKRSGPQSDSSGWDVIICIMLITFITGLVFGFSIFAIIHYKPWSVISRRLARFKSSSTTAPPDDESNPMM